MPRPPVNRDKNTSRVVTLEDAIFGVGLALADVAGQVGGLYDSLQEVIRRNGGGLFFYRWRVDWPNGPLQQGDAYTVTQIVSIICGYGENTGGPDQGRLGVVVQPFIDNTPPIVFLGVERRNLADYFHPLPQNSVKLPGRWYPSGTPNLPRGGYSHVTRKP